MNSAGRASSPRFVYDRCYIEPEIQLRLAEPQWSGEAEVPQLLSEILTYRPTGTRTAAGLYEYELVEESLLE